MKPLHELDALCAEKVAGWTNIQYHEPLEPSMGSFYTGWNPESCRHEGIIPYTTYPAAALDLLEKESSNLAVHFFPDNPPKKRWMVVLFSASVKETARTFALAATLALLRAHGVETE